MPRIDRQLFESTNSNLQECIDEIEAAGGIEDYLLHASPFEKNIVNNFLSLCGNVSEDFGNID